MMVLRVKNTFWILEWMFRLRATNNNNNLLLCKYKKKRKSQKYIAKTNLLK